jgi:Flp pilus assembly protein CpaB
MRSRGLVVGVALVLAIVAAGAVVLYTNGVRQDAAQGGNLVPVIVSTQNIAANTALNTLIDQNLFDQIRVPQDTLVDGAVTSLTQLQDRTTTSAILANEQIPSTRLSGGETVPGGTLGISEGHVGVSIQVSDFQGVAGNISRGDHVALYVTFDKDTPVLKTTMKQLLSGSQFQQVYELLRTGNVTGAVAASPAISLPVPFTVTLVPGVRVLDVSNPALDQETGRRSGDSVMLTLDLTPEDAEAVTFAGSMALSSTATVWFGLLPPDSADGYPLEAVLGPRYALVSGTG